MSGAGLLAVAGNIVTFSRHFTNKYFLTELFISRLLGGIFTSYKQSFTEECNATRTREISFVFLSSLAIKDETGITNLCQDILEMSTWNSALVWFVPGVSPDVLLQVG